MIKISHLLILIIENSSIFSNDIISKRIIKLYFKKTLVGINNN